MARSEASVLPAHANNFVYLNASSTTSSSFIVPIELLPTNVKPIKISALLDSGSSHCFLDNSIVNTYKLPTVPVNPPLQLWLIDGTSNHIITVRVQPFPSYFGYIMHNNILMMLDLVAVTEYYLLEKSANRKI